MRVPLLTRAVKNISKSPTLAASPFRNGTTRHSRRASSLDASTFPDAASRASTAAANGTTRSM